MRFTMKSRLALLSLILLALMLHPLRAQQPPSRPKIFGIALVQIVVSDMHSARDFYSKALNESYPLPDKAVTGSGFPINETQMVVLTTADSPSPVNLLAGITFATSDVRGLRRYLEFHRVNVSASALEGPKDKSLTVADPEGHRISFVEWSADLIKQLSAKPLTARLIHAG